MRRAVELLAAAHPELEADGEMRGDSALNPVIRAHALPQSRLKGEANVLIMPNLDAANIAYQMIKGVADALPVGPILIGAAKPAHILNSSVTPRGVVNMTAVAVVEAQAASSAQVAAARA
jgi:malate dehydrogenase (oxaloacetate-decarboxylating)(NADP+)